MIIESLSALASGVGLWRDHKKERVEEKRRRTQAIATVMDAAITTKAYLHDRSQGTPIDREKEQTLARLWQAAAQAISEYDRQLFNAAEIKALAWADPGEWNRVRGEEWRVSIKNIIEQCTWLRANG